MKNRAVQKSELNSGESAERKTNFTSVESLISSAQTRCYLFVVVVSLALPHIFFLIKVSHKHKKVIENTFSLCRTCRIRKK